MREGARSEAFLSLFTTSDRAASIVGDLLEELPARRRSEYVLRIIGIALSLCLRGIRSAPLRSLAAATTGLTVYLCIWAIAFVASGLPWYPFYRIGDPEFWGRLALIAFFASLFTGYVLGRWVSFGGINPLVPLTPLWLVSWPLDLALLNLLFPDIGLPLLVLAAVAFPLLGLLPLILGGTLARLTMNARTTDPMT